MKRKSPCMACEQRIPGCQSRCTIGLAYALERRLEKERIDQERRKDYMMDSYQFGRMKDTKRR